MRTPLVDTKNSLKSHKKDRFAKAVEKDIDRDLDMIDFSGTNSDLLSPEMKRAKMKHEMLEAVTHSELTQQIPLALALLRDQGADFLTKEAYEAMLANLASAATTLDAFDFSKEQTYNFQKILGINDHTMEAFATVATAKFDAGLYADALALCALMLTLAPENASYWYRTAIAAQNTQKHDFALKAYAAAVDLDPTLYKAWLFMTEYYISQELYSEANTAFEKAKEIVQGTDLEDSWQQMILHIEAVLKAVH